VFLVVKLTTTTSTAIEHGRKNQVPRPGVLESRGGDGNDDRWCGDGLVSRGMGARVEKLHSNKMVGNMMAGPAARDDSGRMQTVKDGGDGDLRWWNEGGRCGDGLGFRHTYG
jgi:hypothetical protein